MTSDTAEEQIPDFKKTLDDRDRRFGSDFRGKKEVRGYIEVPEVHQNVDATWAKGGVGHGR